MPKIDELKGWADWHHSDCPQNEMNIVPWGPCECDVPLKQKLVAFVEVWDSYAFVKDREFKDLFKARKDLEEA